MKKFNFNMKELKDLPPPANGKYEIYRDTVNPYLFCRVNPKSRVLFYQRQIDGKKVQINIDKVANTTVKLARDRVEELNGQKVKGVNIAMAARGVRNEITVGEMYEMYRDRKGKVSKDLVKKWEGHLAKPLKNKRMSEVDIDFAQHVFDKIAKKGPVMANRCAAYAGAIWNFAIYRKGFKGINVWKVERYKEHSRKSKRFYAKDVKPLLEVFATLRPNPNLLFTLVLLSGRRIGECRKARWADIDLETGAWTFFNKKDDEPTIHMLPDYLITRLVAHRNAVHANKKASPFIFAAPTKQGYYTEYMKSWATVRKANPAWATLRTNDLRGSHGTLLRESGVDLDVVSQQLAHSDIKTTVDHYVEHTGSAMKDTADQLMKDLGITEDSSD